MRIFTKYTYSVKKARKHANFVEGLEKNANIVKGSRKQITNFDKVTKKARISSKSRGKCKFRQRLPYRQSYRKPISIKGRRKKMSISRIDRGKIQNFGNANFISWRQTKLISSKDRGKKYEF